MHLGDVLDAFEVRVEGSLPKVAERDRRDNLIELERFEDSRGSDRLASFIWERLQGGGADGEAIRRAIQWYVSRVPDQCVQPSGSDCRCSGALPAGWVSGRTEVTLMSTLIAPKLVSSRDQARELTATLADDLSDTVVMVDCSALQASTPSFVDELVKSVLVDRRGGRLVIKGAPQRTVELARRAARNRGVTDRLETG